MPRRASLASVCATARLGGPAGTHAALPPDAYELRNVGLAQLENERFADAEAAYRKLVELAPREPLGHANLAIALLRQQKFDEAIAAVERR